ncbi:hypothetical protein OZX62_00080 [Bifidobacterium sp. ESL0690]|uniref:hypothetical protein n=1 Tax=Bifidobacterium sp. ESL0690 TaxID=2983214 RepID=UPI0023F9F059|nr:hypothetical protein [Bifidobacterium sp. ESL0690]WEV46749.1 hypothetical protein OZX62_00080 [Bifidobacterium sp. ESL0690]
MTNRYHHTLRIAIILITTMLAAVLPLAACGTATPSTKSPRAQSQNTAPKKKQADKSKTHIITFDTFFVQHFMFSKQFTTAEQAAKGLEEQGKDAFPKADAQPDGSITTTLTDKQLNNDIDWYTKGRQQSIDLFKQAHTSTPPNYHYQLSKDGRELTVWLDKNIAQGSYMAILFDIPVTTGYLYYLHGGTGPWDVHVTINNVHTGQTVQQYLASQAPSDFDRNTFGD